MKSFKKSLFVFVLLLVLIMPTAGWASAPDLAAARLPAQEEEPEIFVVRIYYKNMEDIEQLIEYDLFEFNNLQKKYVLAAVTQDQMDEIEGLGFKVKVDDEETANFQLLFNGLPGEGEISIQAISGYSCYRTVEETYASAAALASNNPTLATWIDAGDTWDKISDNAAPGYDMMVLKLTNSAVSGDKPKFFITASVHAREYAPAELATRFAEYLVNNYNIDADATWLLDHHEIHVMFHGNPDGRKIAEAGSSWRKNRDNDDGCTTTYGVDLNRNFTYQWNTGGSSGVACNETYRGPSAGSEPETQAIQNYLTSTFPDQRGTEAAPADAMGFYADIHSSGGYVMWPWGYTTTLSPNNTQLRTLGRKLAYFNNYSNIGPIASTIYVASGSTVDFAYGNLGIASYAFEIGTAFFQDCTTFTNTILPANLNALLYGAKVARTPYITPLGPDALTLALSANNITIGETTTLTATINDTRYRSGTGEPVQNIAGAEYYIDTPPWVSGAVASSMAASDGNFNATSEGVTGTINTTGLSSGRHIIYVHGRDINNNSGAVSAVFLNLIDPTGVTLVSFTGTAGETDVSLDWETSTEIDNLGFNLYRSTTPDGAKIKLNADIIPSLAPGGSDGEVYNYLDSYDLAVGSTYFYWLADVDSTGSETLHGPVEVQFGEIVEPFVLESFTATGARRAVNLAWITSSELTNAGFNLYRATSSTGTKTKINSSLIASVGPAGGSYTRSNTGLVSNRTYYYWLQAVDTSGATQLFGPVYAKTK